MKKTFLVGLVLQALSLGALAQGDAPEHLFTTDGREYAGWISLQVPGQNIVFRSGDDVLLFQLSQLDRIYYDPRGPEQLTGLVDVVTTRSNQTVRGQIVCQTFGESVTVLGSDGEVNIAVGQILEQRKEPLSPDYTLLQQSPFTNVVVTDEGEFTGVMDRQFYGDGKRPSYLSITQSDGTSQIVQISQVRQLRRMRNPDYIEAKGAPARPATVPATVASGVDASVGGGSFSFAHRQLQPCPVQQKRSGLVGGKLKYYFEEQAEDNCMILDLGGAPLVVELPLAQAAEGDGGYMLLRVERQKVGKEVLYAFSDDDFQNAIAPAMSVVVDGTVSRREYTVGPGVYVFCQQSAGKAYFFEIK